jgi:hypothetical protein
MQRRGADVPPSLAHMALQFAHHDFRTGSAPVKLLKELVNARDQLFHASSLVELVLVFQSPFD